MNDAPQWNEPVEARIVPEGYQLIEAARPQGLSIAGMVTGIVGLAISVIPCFWCFWWLGAITSVVSVILSAVALKAVQNETGGGSGMAITGLVCGIIGTVIGVFWMIVVLGWASEFQKSLKNVKFPRNGQ